MVKRALNTLVTGGAGFIGSHLVEQLLRDGYRVIVLDNFSTGRRENLAHLIKYPDLHVHEVDIAEYEVLQPLFEGVDWVFHLAALADIVPSIEQSLTYHGANVDGTISVLEAARSAGVRRFLYAASSSCYGIPDEFPTPETAPIKPMYPYALTNYLGEHYVLHWNRVYKFYRAFHFDYSMSTVHVPERLGHTALYLAFFWHNNWLAGRSPWWGMGVRPGTLPSLQMRSMPWYGRPSPKLREKYLMLAQAAPTASTI